MKEQITMAVALDHEGDIVFLFGEDRYTVPDQVAMDIAKAIAKCLSHKSSQKRQSA